jgi:taurine dioxygenase
MGPYLGAEIGNVDLAEPLSSLQIQEIQDALAENSVVFFRDQDIDTASLKEFGRCFGTLHIHSGMAGLPDHPEVTRIHADEKSERVIGEEWHTDLSCDAIPPLGSILYLHTVPPLGGDTVFASMYAAYEDLSDRMKTFLADLTATHDGYIAFGHRYPGRQYNRTVHPIIARHPVTGRKLLYVNRGFTARINELPIDESRELLQFLFRHCEKSDFQFRFHWRKNSIAFWDNRCTQHLAIWDYYPHTRSGYRVQIDGDQPVSA